MKEIILNETPVRTSVNFGINNIILKDFEFPSKIQEFDGLEILKGKENVSKNLNFNNSLKYGVSKTLENDINNNANVTLAINAKKVTQIAFNLTDKNNQLAENIEIIAENNDEGTVLLKYKSDNKNDAYHNGICKIKAGKNSKTKVIIVNLLNSNTNNFLSIESIIEEGAKLEVVIIDLGGNITVTNYYTNLSGKFSSSNVDSIYLGKDEQKIDINYIAHLNGEKSNCNIEVQGALKDKAIKNFKGTIDFKTGAVKSIGAENEFCMLLSDKAKSKALPMLLCTEEDVEGSHSTATGKVDESELFYLMTRGFSKKEAMKLIVKANFSAIIDKINDESLKEEIINEVDNRLD